MRAIALLLTALLLAQVAATEPNQRTSPVLEVDEPITAFGMGGDGRLIVGSSDSGSDELGDNPNEIVWTMWNNLGQLENSGTADASDCTVDPLNGCTSHVIAVEANHDGRRLAIAATDEDGGGRLLFLTAPQGQVSRLELAGSVTAMDMTPTGSHLAVTMRINAVIGADTGRLNVYEWGDTVTLAWSTDFTTIPNAVALSADGQVAYVGAETQQRVRSSSSTEYSLVQGVRAMAASSTTDHWNIAGYQTGDWAVFSDESDTDPFAPEYAQRPTSSAVTAVAMTEDARYWAVGHQDGSLRLYANRDLVQPASANLLLSQVTMGGAVQDLHFSSDGRYLIAGGGDKIALYFVDHTEEDPSTFTGLREYFKKDMGAPIVGVGSDSLANQIGVAHGVQASVFTAIHDIAVTAPGAAGAVREGAGSVEVTYTNDGNRYAELRLFLSGQGDWDAAVSSNKFGLHPGEAKTVTVSVTAPTNSSVESRTLVLDHKLNGGDRVATSLPFQVNQVHFWAIEPEGTFNSAIQPGQTVTFQAKVSNLGNGLDASDLIVSVDENGWQASVTPTTLSLPAKGSAIVQVSMTAPSNALDLATSRATLRLSADTTAFMGFTATVGAKFGLDVQATLLNITGAIPGGEAIAEIRVTNTGNSVDMIRLEAVTLPTDWQVKFRNEDAVHFVLDLQPGSTKVEPVRILIPAYDQIVSRGVTLRATSLGNESLQFDFPLQVQVQAPPEVPEQNETEEPPVEKVEEKSPGLPMLALLLVIALVAHRRMRIR